VAGAPPADLSPPAPLSEAERGERILAGREEIIQISMKRSEDEAAPALRF